MVLPGQLGNGQEGLLAVYGTGGIIGIDDQDGLGPGGDLAADILQVRVPVLLRVAAIMDRLSAAQVGIVAPQGIAGRGHQHLVSGANQGGEQHGHGLTDAVADIDIVQGNTLEPLALVVGQNGFPGGKHTPDLAVGHRLVHLGHQGLPDAFRQSKAKVAGIACIQL